MLNAGWKQKPPAGSRINYGDPLAQGLAAAWLFNENSGPIVRDLTGRYNGTITDLTTGVSWFSSIYGSSVNCNGVNRWITTPFNQALADFSCTVWFNMAGSGNTATNRIVDKAYDTGFWIGRDNTGTGGLIECGIQETSAPYGTVLAAADDTWHKLILTRQGTLKSIFLDGVLAATATVSSAVTGTTNLNIGYSGGGNAMVGSIALVMMHTRALSLSEMQRITYNPFCMIVPRSPVKFYSYAAPSVAFIAPAPFIRSQSVKTAANF